MKHVTLVIMAAFLAATTTVHAGWSRTYGPGSGRCIQITSDGNYIISSRKGLDVRLLKVDTSGNVLWDRTYITGAESWTSNWVEQTSDGGYIVAGTPDLLKTDANGDSLWARDYGIIALCVDVTDDGGYIITGGKEQIHTYLKLIKTDASGNVEWDRTYGTDDIVISLHCGNFVRQTSDGSYIVTGETGFEHPDSSRHAIWLLKMDENGDTVWTRKYEKVGVEANDHGYCVQETSDSSFIVTGTLKNNVYLQKTNSEGDSVWAKRYTTSLGGTGLSVQQTDDEGYVVVGVTGHVGALNRYVDIPMLWLLKTDSLGDTTWTRFYGSQESADVGHCVRQTPDGGYIGTGNLSGEVWILRTDSLGLLNVDEENLISELVNDWQIISSVGPRVVFHYWDSPEGFHASVFDASGRKVDVIHTVSPSGVITWGSDQSPGVYFIKPKDNNHKAITAKVVIVH